MIQEMHAEIYEMALMGYLHRRAEVDARITQIREKLRPPKVVLTPAFDVEVKEVKPARVAIDPRGRYVRTPAMRRRMAIAQRRRYREAR